MRQTAAIAVATTGVLLALGGSWAPGSSNDHDDHQDHHGRHGTEEVRGTFHDTDGKKRGTVTIEETDDGTRVSVRVSGFDKEFRGFHGFHVHAVGECDADSTNPANPAQRGPFLSAGGHLGADKADHGEHKGDLPSLYVSDDGDGRLVTVTDMFTPEDLLDKDGSAVMIHVGRDNFANIPERYDPDADAMTLATGDAGGRAACAVVKD
jgi:superoxide dismutase, Cu-Zn family